MDIAALKEYAEKAAAEYGIKDWELLVYRGTSKSAKAVKRELSQSDSSTSTALSIRIIRDNREGSAASEVVSEDEIAALFEKAIDNAQINDSDNFPEIFEGSREYPSIKSIETERVSLNDLKNRVLNVNSSLLSSDSSVKDGSSVAAAFAESEKYQINSKGLMLSSKGSGSYIMSHAICEKDGEVKSAYSVKEDYSSDVSDSVSKAVSQFGASKVKSGIYDVVFSPECMQQILDTFFSVFTLKSGCLGLSSFYGKEGSKVASSVLNIVDDPLYEDYHFASAFDGDGMATHRKDVIRNGVLNTLLSNREWARRAGKESSANSYRSASGGASSIIPYSFYIEKGSDSLKELFSKADGGLYVTQMKGFHAGANPVSGDFSIDSSGYLIKDGEALASKEGFTVAGNFYTLLENIEAVASDLEFDVTLSASRFGSPSLLVRGLSIAGD